MKIKFYTLSFILLVISISLSAQTPLSDSLKSRYHAFTIEEITNTNRNTNEIVTTPPTGTVRNIAEFEPNQGVIIAYIPPGAYQGEGFQIPIQLIKEIAKDIKVYIICKNKQKTDKINDLLSTNEVNTDNVEYILGDIESQWVRDFTPWYIEYGDNHSTAGINFKYNRPRPYDNNSYTIISEHFGMDIFTMDLVQTGGNYMTDGFGVSASCDVVKEENKQKSEEGIKTIMQNYLGITKYHIVNDPLDDYIEHVDCWGKFLDVDKILIAKVPDSDPRHAEFEAMANYWANQTSSYGNKYKVHRVNWKIDGNAYTNSLIVNDKVLVPINHGNQFSQYNQDAIAAYQEAMPGYKIVGIEYNNWFSTDALHCRTHEVPDLNMLRIKHIPYYGIIDNEGALSFNAEIYSLNNSQSINSVKLVYKVNDNNYTEIDMLPNGNTYTVSIDNLINNDTVSYYIKATDDRPKTEKHPYIGENNPHKFVINTPSSSETEFSQNKGLLNSNVKAFPNPATNELYFVTNNIPSNNYLVQIINPNGQIIESFSIDKQTNDWERHRIDISKLSPGLYQIRAISNSDVYSTRFIKR